MEFNKQEKTEILRQTLKGRTDKQIAVSLRVRETTLKYQRTYGQLPKRKDILGFIAEHVLSRIGAKAHANSLDCISGDFLVSALNSLGVNSTTLKTWTSDSVKRFLERLGVRCKNNTYVSKALADIKVKTLDQLATYNVWSIDPENHIPSIDGLEFEGIPLQEITGPKINQKKDELKIAIEEALAKGCATVSDVTKYLNANGYQNNAGKEFGRWSVKIFMQEAGLDAHLKVDAKQYSDLMEDWVLTHPTDKEITRESFIEKLKEYLEEGEILKYISKLYSELSGIISEHNKNYKEYQKIERYREKVEFAVHVKYKHKPITAEEIGEELGLSPQHGNRIMRKYLGIEPFDVWFDNLYQLVKIFVAENPDFNIQQLADYLQTSYIRSQRGGDWDFATTNLTYQRLQERYPNLPPSKGMRK